MSSTSNLTGGVDGSQVPNVYAASIIAIVLSGVFFIGRLCAKRIQRQALNASDYALILGLLCCWGLAIVNLWMTTVGLGRHFAWVKEQDPSLSSLKHLLKTFIADEVFYDLGIASVKISILLLYKSLFGGDRKFNLAANVLMAVVGAWFLGNLLPSIFSCRPIAGFWNLDPNAKCISKTALYASGSSINIATDIAILCLPLFKVAKLHLSWRRRCELIVVFLLGSFVCVVSIYRFTVLFASNAPDLTWYFATVLNWSAIEVATAIASACLPLMRPLFLAAVPRAWATTRSNTAQDAYTSPQQQQRRSGPAPQTIGSLKTPPPAVTRHRSLGVGLSTNKSEFEHMPDSSFLITTDSDRGLGMDSYGGSGPEPRDVESGYGGRVPDRIMVTKTFEMSSVDRLMSTYTASQKRSDSDSETSSKFTPDLSTQSPKHPDSHLI